MIRVLVVDDSAVIRTLLKRSLSKDPRIEVVGEAYDGKGAIEQNRLLHPDVITMDIYMPVMNGIEATKVIMQESPAAIIIFSTEDSARMGYAALEAGAVDMLKKPDLTHFSPNFYRSFIDRLVAVTERGHRSPVFARRTVGTSPFQKPADVALQKKTVPEAPAGVGVKDLLVIGASTGGPVAVQKVLSGIGRDFPYPILVTQHIDSSFDSHYASWLADTTKLDVRLAEDNGMLVPGTVYIAPANCHLIVGSRDSSGRYITRLVDDPPLNYLKPAVDYLFRSAAKVAGSRCIAVLLTGMGKDGAAGCVDIYKNGGYTIAEAEETCVVFGMPKAAIDLGAASTVMPLYDIAPYVRRMAGLR